MIQFLESDIEVGDDWDIHKKLSLAENNSAVRSYGPAAYYGSILLAQDNFRKAAENEGVLESDYRIEKANFYDPDKEGSGHYLKAVAYKTNSKHVATIERLADRFAQRWVADATDYKNGVLQKKHLLDDRLAKENADELVRIWRSEEDNPAYGIPESRIPGGMAALSDKATKMMSKNDKPLISQSSFPHGGRGELIVKLIMHYDLIPGYLPFSNYDLFVRVDDGLAKIPHRPGAMERIRERAREIGMDMPAEAITKKMMVDDPQALYNLVVKGNGDKSMQEINGFFAEIAVGHLEEGGTSSESVMNAVRREIVVVAEEYAGVTGIKGHEDIYGAFMEMVHDGILSGGLDDLANEFVNSAGGVDRVAEKMAMGRSLRDHPLFGKFESSLMSAFGKYDYLTDDPETAQNGG